MDFKPAYFDDKVNILLSDYTLNTVFFMVQQSSFLRKTIFNDTSNPLPMNVDTQSLAQLIPELGTFFPTNYPINLVVFVDPFDNTQPIIRTNIDGSHLNLNVTMEFNVVNSTDAFDDPYKAVAVTLAIDLKLQIVTKNELLSIQIVKATVNDIELISGIGELKKDVVKASLNSMINIALKSVEESLKNIDVRKIVKEKLGLDFTEFNVDPGVGYMEIALNMG